MALIAYSATVWSYRAWLVMISAQAPANAGLLRSYRAWHCFHKHTGASQSWPSRCFWYNTYFQKWSNKHIYTCFSSKSFSRDEDKWLKILKSWLTQYRQKFDYLTLNHDISVSLSATSDWFSCTATHILLPLVKYVRVLVFGRDVR